jgi:hypothetical protein
MRTPFSKTHQKKWNACVGITSPTIGSQNVAEWKKERKKHRNFLLEERSGNCERGLKSGRRRTLRGRVMKM